MADICQKLCHLFRRLGRRRRPRFIDVGIFKKLSWEPTDVVVACGHKQGTNWGLNIVHQIRMQGDENFEDILIVCLWLEFLSHPGETGQDILAKAEEHKKRYPFRVFKTHEMPPVLPFNETVKYLVLVRNGKDTLVSDFHFSQKMSNEFQEMWHTPQNGTELFATFFKNSINSGNYWRFINSWWPYRHKKNVFMIHFCDLKKDPAKNIRAIAAFLGVTIPEERWPHILEHCSFSWMKEHAIKFESPLVVGSGKMIDDGGMIRKGIVGEYQGMFSTSDEVAWEKAHIRLMPDATQRNWVDHGGRLP